MKKLARWRIDPSCIEFPEDACEFYGGHATVSKAFFTRDNESDDPISHSDTSEEDSEEAGSASKSDEKGYPAEDDEGEEEDSENEDQCGSEEEDSEDENEGEEQESDDETSGWRKAVEIKETRISENTDLERALGLALREAEFLVELFHPNIVTLKGFVENASENIIWLVFPWTDNGNLKHFVASRDWEIPERISLIDDVVEGLEYLHNQEPPICHGDLKSLNILVNSKHLAVITDFGSARRLGESDPDSQANDQSQSAELQAIFCASTNTITLTGNKYTLRWAAPELLIEDRMSLWSDIWALGWIFYEVMTSSIPFQDVAADVVVVERVIRGDLPSVTDSSRMSLLQELCSLMITCWRSIPTERPTAEYCRKAINWMPMIIPNSTRVQDPAVPAVRSPELLLQLGYMYKSQSEYVEAVNSFTEVLHICTDIHDRQGRADVLWGLAEVHRLQSEYSKAITHYSEALQTYSDVGDRQGRAHSVCGLAEVHQLRDEYKEAIAHYCEALQIYTYIGDAQGRADVLWGVAEVHRRRHEYSHAIIHYSEALKICTDSGDRQGRADALSGLAQVHRLRNEDSEALIHYSEVLQICTDIGDRKGRANALWGLAEVHRLRSEYNDALTLYSEALQICIGIGNRQGRADALWGLAEVHRLRNEYSDALADYCEALQIRTNIGDRRGRAEALQGLADLHRGRDQYNDAACFYQQAAEIFEHIGNSDAAANAFEHAAGARRVTRD